jgi:hypothetical protein
MVLPSHRGSHRFAANDALEAHCPHQARHRASGDIEALTPQLPPDLANAVDTEVRLEHPSDLILQGGVDFRASR